MSISFASATGNLFNRMGKLGLVLKQLSQYQASQLTNLTDVTSGVTGQYNSESDLQSINGGAYIGNLNNAGSIGSTMSSLGQQTVNRMVFRDNPQFAQSLQNVNLVAAIKEIIRQMQLSSATVQACTITATNGTFTGTGNGAINSSTKRPSDGLVLENTFAETMKLLCTQDSYIGGATAGQEVFTLTGQGNQSDVYAFNWPLGSNARINLAAIPYSQDASGGNLMTNSDFENWTTNVPNNWSLLAGVAGTNIAQETVFVYDGLSAVKVIGDGTTNFAITQTFNLTAGTTGILDELTQYSFNMWLRRDGVIPGTGIITVDLVDSGNTVINDAAGNPNSFTINLTGLTTVYTAYSGSFRTPAILPSTVKVRIRLSTALTAGRSVYFDGASMGAMNRTYVGGPYVSVHSGNVNFVQGDYSYSPIFTNNRGGASNLATFQTLWDRLLGMRQNALLLPSSLTPTISDSLIG